MWEEAGERIKGRKRRAETSWKKCGDDGEEQVATTRQHGEMRGRFLSRRVPCGIVLLLGLTFCLRNKSI